MPNGHGSKEYGKHKYVSGNGRSDCKFNCGCWVADSTSGGPLGLDPFGTCPGNALDGKLIGGQADYHHVVEQRIHDLEVRATAAEAKLKRVTPTKRELAKKLRATEAELEKKNQLLVTIQDALSRNSRCS